MKKLYKKGKTLKRDGYKIYTIDIDDFDENEFLFVGYIQVYSNKYLRNAIIKFLNKK